MPGFNAAYLLAGAALLVAGTPRAAPPSPSPPPPGPSGGHSGVLPGDFEEYVMALEWQPSWSGGDCGGDKQPVADHTGMPGGSHARQYLSLHGMWPTYAARLAKHGGYDWPQFCNATGSGGPDFSPCEQDPSLPVCQPDAASLARFNVTQNGWKQWALEYAWGDLAGHEWGKHGGCTPWSSPDSAMGTYFELQSEALANITAGLGATLVHQSVRTPVHTPQPRAARCPPSSRLGSLPPHPDFRTGGRQRHLRRARGRIPPGRGRRQAAPLVHARLCDQPGLARLHRGPDAAAAGLAAARRRRALLRRARRLRHVRQRGHPGLEGLPAAAALFRESDLLSQEVAQL